MGFWTSRYANPPYLKKPGLAREKQLVSLYVLKDRVSVMGVSIFVKTGPVVEKKKRKTGAAGIVGGSRGN